MPAENSARSNAQPVTQPAPQRWLTNAIVALIVLACLNLVSKRTVDPDLWGHIQYGEDWLAEGTLPRTASHTYADPNYTWINHENLSELALAFGHRWIGGRGLMIAKTLLALGIFLSMIVHSRRRDVELMMAAACLFPVAGGIAEWWCARPQMASFLGMVGLLLVLERSFRKWHESRAVNYRTLWLVIPLLMVWTNSHGGFLAGLGVLLAYLGLRGLETLYVNRKQAWPQILCLAGIGIATGLGTLVNPYGTDLHAWLLASLGDARPEISEWKSIPDSGLIILPYVALVLLTIVCAVFTRKRRDPVHLVIMALVALQTFMHCRHIPFLAIMFGYWMPVHVNSVFQRWLASRPARDEPPITRKAAMLLGAQFGLCVLGLAGFLAWQIGNFGVQRDKFPVSAIEYMSEHGLQGRIVVTFDWAQYTLVALPDSQVGFDGRFRTCYTQEVVDMNFDLIMGDDPDHRNRAAESGPFDPTKVLEFGKPDFVMVDRNLDQTAIDVLSKHVDWVLLYQDSLAQVYARASRYDDPALKTYVAPSQRELGESVQSGIATWPALPNRSGRNAFVLNSPSALAAR